jgi:superfamily II DNA or RNA helicase
VKKQLRDYQFELVDSVWSEIMNSQTALAVLPTGTGKTQCISELVRKSMSVKDDIKIIMLMGRIDLVKQTEKVMHHEIGEKSVGVFCGSMNRREIFRPLTLGSIQSIKKQKTHADLIIVDEVHHLDADDGAYADFLNSMQTINPKLKTVGFTATPFRADGLIYGDDMFFKRIAYRKSVKEMILAGWLCEPKMKGSAAEFDVSNLRIRAGEYRQEDVDQLVNNKSKITEQVFDALSKMNERKCVAWACANIDHCENVLHELVRQSESATIVHSKLSSEDREKNLNSFLNGEVRHVVFVSILSEGFNHPPIDCIVMMRPTRSPVLYVQCLDYETEILTNEGFKKYNEIKENHKCLSYNIETKSLESSNIKNIFDREIGENEKMFSIKTPQIDIRITGGHRMIFETKKIKDQKFISAEELSKKESAFIPVSCKNNSCDNQGLSDNDLSFIGWFMTDGTINKKTNAISISQSSGSPFLKHLEETIKKCNFKYRIQKINGNSNFTRNHTDFRFHISKGKPRSLEKEKTGWSRLEKFLSKDFSKNLFSISERQFDILIESIHFGDGTKQDGQSWKRRSYHITKGNKKFIENLQIMAIKNGYSANISTILKRKENYNDQYCLHLKKINKRFFAINPSDKRASFKEDNKKEKERVWCVENYLSTLIIRRNGKTAIVGNCVGRGLRLYHGKKDCLVLDYGQVIKTLGPIDDPHIKGVGRATTGEAPQKQCPNCYSFVPTGVINCPECEFVFQRESTVEKLNKKSDQESNILSVENKPKVLIITKVKFEMYLSKSGNECVLITYYEDYDDSVFSQIFNHGAVKEYFVTNNEWAMNRFRLRIHDLDVDFIDVQFIESKGSWFEPRYIEVTKIFDGKFDKIIKVKNLSRENAIENQQLKLEDVPF